MQITTPKIASAAAALTAMLALWNNAENIVSKAASYGSFAIALLVLAGCLAWFVYSLTSRTESLLVGVPRDYRPKRFSRMMQSLAFGTVVVSAVSLYWIQRSAPAYYDYGDWSGGVSNSGGLGSANWSTNPNVDLVTTTCDSAKANDDTHKCKK